MYQILIKYTKKKKQRLKMKIGGGGGGVHFKKKKRKFKLLSFYLKVRSLTLDVRFAVEFVRSDGSY